MSNFIVPISTDLLLSEAASENLYLKLIEQINKDFNLANEAIDFPMSTTPDELKIQLHEKIYRLIQYKNATCAESSEISEPSSFFIWSLEILIIRL